MRFAASFFLVVMPALVWAQSTDEQMRTQATAAIEGALTAFDGGDLSALMAARSDAQLDVLADAAGVSREALLEAHAEKVRKSLEIVSSEASRLVPETVSVMQTPTGTPYVLAMVEEYWRMDEANLHRVVSPVVAFEHRGKWVLTNVTKPRDYLSLRQAHPEFLEVDFPSQKMERIPENKLPAVVQDEE